MLTAENIYNAYHARRQSQSWAEWAGKNPELEKMLNEAELIDND